MSESLNLEEVDRELRDVEQSQAQTFDEVLAGAEFFRTGEDEPYADIHVAGHRETHPVRSNRFKTWLRREFKSRRGRAPHPPALDQAREEAIALALDDGEERKVCIRTARGNDGAIYIDLCDDDWRTVRVTRDGWTLASDPPVRFRRSKSMRALPIPNREGSLEGLRSILNLAGETDFVLVVSFMLAAMYPDAPYPFLAVRGAQGTAKTTFVSIVESIIDPGLEYPRSMPKGLRDAAIAARNSHVLSFDNVSKIDSSMSDFLCRLSTGASAAIRALYSDSDEVYFQSRNPVILNGITEVVNRPDLSERCIFLELEPIPPSARRLESDVRAQAEEIRPAVLGALLDAMAHGMKMLPTVALKELPRMADFARWATACEGRWFDEGSFAAAYADNQNSAVDATIQASPFMQAVRDMMDAEYSERDDFWQGTCGALLSHLNQRGNLSDGRNTPPGWPGSVNAVSRGLDRAVGPFAKIGIEVSRGRRSVTIQRTDLAGARGSSSRTSVASVGSVTADCENEALLPRSEESDDASNARDASSGVSNPLDGIRDTGGNLDIGFEDTGF